MGTVRKSKASIEAFNAFKVKAFQERVQQFPDDLVDPKELHQLCLARWKKLRHAQKRSYEPPKKLKKKRDPNLPKRPLSAFFWFCNENRALVREQHPDWSLVETSQELGSLWRNAGVEVKDRFKVLAARDSLRYKREMELYSAGDQAKGQSTTKTGEGGTVGEIIPPQAPVGPHAVKQAGD